MHAGSMHANIHEIMQFDWCHNLLTHALITTYLSNICEAAVILSAAVISIMASTEEKAKHLTIIHFNDVYNIEPTKDKGEFVGGAARFTTKVKELAKKEPLVLFSGDALGPSRSKPTFYCHSYTACTYYDCL